MTDLALDIAALCAAIDAGDDAVLPILADALEEAGDALAVGLRLAAEYAGLLGCNDPDSRRQPEWGWYDIDFADSSTEDALWCRLWHAAPCHILGSEGDASMTLHPTRSLAFLALAEALSHA